MLGALLLVACGGGDSFEMPEPSDIFGDGRSLLPHAEAHKSGAKVAKSLGIERVAFIEVDGFSVRETACAFGFGGVPLGSSLSEETCLESEQEFAKRLKDWSQAQAESHEYAPDGVRSLLRQPTSFAAELSALGELAEGLPSLMEMAARSSVAGLPETPWECVEDLLDTQSGLVRDINRQQCSHETRDAEKTEQEQVLRALVEKSVAAAAIKDSGTRSPLEASHPACSMEAVNIDSLPHNARIGLSSKKVYAISALQGESLSLRANGRGGADPRLTLYAEDCSSQIGYDDDGGGGRNSFIRHYVRESGTLYVKADFYGSGSGQADLSVDTDGSGGPSAEQVAEAQVYLNWFGTHFAGVSEELVDEAAPGIWGEGSARRDLVNKIILGTRRSGTCLQSEYTDHEAITQSMIWDDAISTCKNQIQAALGEMHEMGWPVED